MFESRYTFGARVGAPFDEIRARVETTLRAEGFGVLTEIDVAATMRAKLGIEGSPYVILGACNPPLAHRALTADPSIGALLPCNVVVRVDGDETVVEAMDPRAALGLVEEPAVADVAAEARARLIRMVQAIESGAGQDPASSSPASTEVTR
jgi:uncharacterized protein (DUF302 family)